MYISDLLDAMRFDGHIVVKKRSPAGLISCGGGSAKDISFRFGYMHVKCTTIIDGILVIVV